MDSNIIEQQDQTGFNYDKHKDETLKYEQIYNKISELRQIIKESNLEPFSKTKGYQKHYYDEIGKEKNKHREDYHCSVCNKSVKYFSKTTHLKSKKHIENIKKV